MLLYFATKTFSIPYMHSSLILNFHHHSQSLKHFLCFFNKLILSFIGYICGIVIHKIIIFYPLCGSKPCCMFHTV